LDDPVAVSGKLEKRFPSDAHIVQGGTPCPGTQVEEQPLGSAQVIQTTDAQIKRIRAGGKRGVEGAWDDSEL
jgi:hypothetical protein